MSFFTLNDTNDSGWIKNAVVMEIKFIESLNNILYNVKIKYKKQNDYL